MAKPKNVVQVASTEEIKFRNEPQIDERVACRCFGLKKDPVTRYGYEYFFLVTIDLNEDGQVLKQTVSDQSWFMWEAIHKLERQTELSVIELKKNAEPRKENTK